MQIEGLFRGGHCPHAQPPSHACQRRLCHECRCLPCCTTCQHLVSPHLQTSIGGGDVQFAWVPSETCVDDPFDPKWNCQQCNQFDSKCLVCKAGYSFDAQNRCAKVCGAPLPAAAHRCWCRCKWHAWCGVLCLWIVGCAQPCCRPGPTPSLPLQCWNPLCLTCARAVAGVPRANTCNLCKGVPDSDPFSYANPNYPIYKNATGWCLKARAQGAVRSTRGCACLQCGMRWRSTCSSGCTNPTRQPAHAPPDRLPRRSAHPRRPTPAACSATPPARAAPGATTATHSSGGSARSAAAATSARPAAPTSCARSAGRSCTCRPTA